ncbi:MAG: hypothetical protein ACPGPD_04000 [Pseudomonadales bacterium]
MAHQKRPFKRRQYLINPGFQLKFMLYLALAVLAVLTVLYTSNYLYYDQLIAQGKDIGLNAQHPYFNFINEQRLLLNRVYFFTAAVAFVLLMVFGLFLSHRIAGPIYRLEKYMNQIRAGEEGLDPVRLRKGDFFPELADIVNGLVTYFTADAREQSEIGDQQAETRSD